MSQHIDRLAQPRSIIMALGEDKKSGVSSGVTTVTSTIGNGVGGLLGTVGSVTGAAARGSEFCRTL
jgi:hypothetical protein